MRRFVEKRTPCPQAAERSIMGAIVATVQRVNQFSAYRWRSIQDRGIRARDNVFDNRI